MSKSFLIIGLGRFGQSTARMLTTLGHEVLAVDKRADRVNAIKDSVLHAVQADTTDERAIAQLVYPDCGSGAQDGGDKGSGGREDKGVAHGTEGLRIAEELTVPVEREAGEHGKALRLVEGEHEQDRDRREKEDHNDRGIYLCGRFHFAPLLTRL